jgi:hypothetical protein
VIDSQEEHDDLPAEHFLDEQEYSDMATPELTSLVLHEDDECVAREALLSVKTSAPPVEESRRNNSLTGCINLSGNSRVEKNGFKYTPGSSWVPRLQQDCLREPCAVSARRSSSYIPSGAGKGHQLCAGCEIFIGSAAQVCFPLHPTLYSLSLSLSLSLISLPICNGVNTTLENNTVE